MQMIPWLLLAIVSLVTLLLLIKLYLMKKAADEIRISFAERLAVDTNTLIDISSRDRHMRQLANDINRQLTLLKKERRFYEQGDAELKEAVTNIAHDLRTPLTAMIGYLDLLEREEQSEAVKRYLSMIANRTAVLKQLTEELFRYSVIVSVKEETKEMLSLNSVLEESLAAAYEAFTQKNIKPVISIPEQRVERYLNRSALVRIFGNIIGNALKYSEGDFYVEMTKEGSITFSNTAKKLTKVSVGKLFDRFFTVENGQNATGLGLSIAKLLTERMGGRITADYRDGKLLLTVSFLVASP